MSLDLTDPVVVLALTCRGEARGDGYAGMAAVAAVVLNRVRHPRWWGDTVRSVCLLPRQFSCWNADDPNYTVIMASTLEQSDYRDALGIAYYACQGWLPDPTGGADSYYALSMNPPPYWAVPPSVHTCDIGSQSFWRVQLLAGASEKTA